MLTGGKGDDRGFIHTSMVLNIDVLHGGLNLYNNGFSGGLVAMMIIPLLDFFTNRGHLDF